MDIYSVNRKKAEYAKTNLRRCARNGSLSESQHRALAMLATYRHKMHVDRKVLFDDESGRSSKYLNFLKNTMPIMLHQASLPNLDLSEELGVLIPKTKAGEYADSRLPKLYFEHIADLVAEQINLKIEDYLGGMDYEFGTSYAPSRISRYEYNAGRMILQEKAV